MIRTGIKVDLDIGDFVSNAGRMKGTVSSITEEMKKAEKAGDWNKYTKLKFDRDRFDKASTGYDRSLKLFADNPKFNGIGASGQPVFKVDQKYSDLITRQIDVMKKLTDSYNAARSRGDDNEAMSLSSQLSKEQGEFSKLIEKATGTGADLKKDAVGEAVKGIAMNQIVGAIKSGMDIWVSSLDRTAVINNAGSGNMLGASLAERQRRTNRITGVLDTTGAAAQGVGMALAPFTGGISLIAGTAANMLTKVFSTLSEAEQKIYANRIAFSTLWDQHKEDAMRLAAMSGDPSFARGAWKTAADVSEKHGYSVDEGAELIKQAAQQGLGVGAADQVFRYERATGADRGALASLVNTAGRYGNGDALAAAWRGLNASGMKPGQLNEMLRSMQRAVEDGISKGFIHSTDQVARNLVMLTQMTNNDPLWTGEQGARRLEKMNSGLGGAVGLQSTSDIMAFRAAKRVLGGNTPYEDALALMERGIGDKEHGTDFMREIMNVIKEVQGEDRSGSVEVLRDIFGFNYNEAIKFYDSWKLNKGMIDNAQLDFIANRKAKALPEGWRETPEFKASVESMEVQNLVVRAGMKFWDEDMSAAIKEARRSYQETTGKLLPDSGNADVSDIAKITGLPGASSIYEAAPYIKTRIGAVIPDYFRGRGENKEINKLGAMFDRASTETDLTAAFNTLQLLDNLPKSVRERWDRENTLNPVVNDNGTLVQILEALRQLIDVEEKNSEVSVEILNY